MNKWIYNFIDYCTTYTTFLKWATAWQNQLNDLCAQQRLRSAWASAPTDQSSLCIQWVAKDPWFLHADSKDFDQTGWISRLIWVFAGRTCHFVGFVMLQLMYLKHCLGILLLIVPCVMGILPLKGKGTQKYKWILSKSIWKTAHFDANCMKIGFLFFKILRFYVFKMPANRGRHFEIKIKTENY